MLNLVRMVLSNRQFFHLRISIEKHFLVVREEISVLLRWNHRDVLDHMFILRDQSGLVLLKVKVNVDQHLSLSLGKSQLELLLVPAFANPAHVFNRFALQGMVFPDDSDLEAIHLLLIDGVQQRFLLFFNDQEPSRVDPAVVTAIVDAVYVFVWL